MDLITVLIGPLAVPECRRALARGWLIVARALTGSVLALVVLSLVWYWWMFIRLDPGFEPDFAVQWAMMIASIMMVTVVMVIAPAILAGSIAGDRERGVLALVLATTATPREIVLGRLAGKLSQVGMILLAGIPPLALLAAWNDLGALGLAALLILLAGLGLGGAGMALMASVLSRRGRDALLAVYLFTIVLLLAPLAARLGLPSAVDDVLGWLSPYRSLGLLVENSEATPALATAGLWSLLGLAGVAVAAWRLRPSCLSSTDRGRLRRARRPWRVPLVADRPMLWKELYIERVGTLGRFGRWLGALVTLALGGGSVGLSAVIVWSLFWSGNTEWSDWATGRMTDLLEGTGLLMGWLIQWAIGLRAAVAIASERERSTWDALLTSPLEPGEIVWAKVYGSLFALRGMLAAIVLAWALGAVFQAVTLVEALGWLGRNAAMGFLMAAVGVRASLVLPTATRAMTWTIGTWLASLAIIPFLAATIIAVGFMVFLAYSMMTISFNPTAPFALMGIGGILRVTWPILNDAIVPTLIAVLIVIETRLRFDRLAGRITGGAAEQAVDAMFHGPPSLPVRLDTGPRSRKAQRRENHEDATKPPSPAIVQGKLDQPSASSAKRKVKEMSS
jgi:ABC-type Na+ efflux pump permease subunit